MREITLNVSEFGGVATFNPKETQVLNLLAYLLLQNEEAYPNHPIGLNLRNLQFKNFDEVDASNISSKITDYMANEFPFMRINSVDVKIVANSKTGRPELIVSVDINFNEQLNINDPESLKKYFNNELPSQNIQAMYRINSADQADFSVYTN